MRKLISEIFREKTEKLNDKWRKLVNASGAILYNFNFHDAEFILEEE